MCNWCAVSFFRCEKCNEYACENCNQLIDIDMKKANVCLELDKINNNEQGENGFEITYMLSDEVEKRVTGHRKNACQLRERTAMTDLEGDLCIKCSGKK